MYNVCKMKYTDNLPLFSKENKTVFGYICFKPHVD